jgi:translocation and assembly module TamB
MTKALNIKSFFKWFAIALASLLLVFLLITSWLLLSTSGLQWLSAKATSSVSGLSIQKVTGRLIGAAELQGVQFTDDNIQISVEQLSLNWQLKKLFIKTLSITELSAKGVHIKQLAPSAPTSNNNQSPLAIEEVFNTLKLPIEIWLQNIEFSEVEYQSLASENTIGVDILALNAFLKASSLEVDKLNIKSDVINADGFLKLNYSESEPTRGEINWSVITDNIESTSDLKPLSGKTLITGNISKINIDNQLSAPYQSTINLRLEQLPQDLFINGNIDIHSINLPDINSAWPNINLKGSNNIRSNLQDFQFDINTEITVNELKENATGHLLASGDGNRQQINLNELSLTNFLGNLSGQGSIQYDPSIEASFVLNGKNINPGLIAPTWPGELNLEIVIETEDGNKNLLPVINSKMNITGTLRKYPVSANIIGSYSNENIFIDKVHIQSQDSRVQLTGHYKTEASSSHKSIFTDWDIDSQDLGEFLPGAKGTLQTKGSFNSILDTGLIPSILHSKLDATLNASEVYLAQKAINNLQVNANFDWSKPSTVKREAIVSVTADNLELDDNHIDKIALNARGTPDNHNIAIDIAANQGQLESTIEGKIIQKQDQFEWLFSLLKMNLAPSGLAPWTLLQAANGAISSTQQQLEQTCLSSQQARLCLQGEGKANQASSATFKLEKLPIEYFSSLLPEDIKWANSEITASGKFRSNANAAPNAKLTLRTTSGQISWDTIANTSSNASSESTNIAQMLQLEPGNLNVVANDQSIDIDLSLPFQQQQGLNSSLKIDNNHSALVKRKVSGSIKLDLSDLTPFSGFIHDSNDLKGNITGEWKIGGIVSEPEVSGELLLNDAQVRLNSPGILLENIQAKLKGKGSQGISYQASMNSGGGQLNINGELTFDKHPKVELKLTGDKAQVFGTEEIAVFVSPDLLITTTNNTVDVQGDVIIPKARITPKQLPESVATVSEDQIIISDDAKVQDSKTSQNINLDLNLALGEDVLIDGFGFKGNATGNLQIKKKAEAVTQGKGVISILNGEYRAFGQGLVIEKGDIIFSDGPVSKPGLDIKAVRRPDEGISVGIFARGNITQPKITLFSEPSMTQTEQLSWLVLGRPIEQSSEGESNALNELLLSYSLSRGDNFVNKIGKSFNLDTVNIKTGTGEAGAARDNDLAELVLGKYLSPKLYISYGIGLFQPINVLSLEYSLSRRWTLKSETSSETSGGDFVYSMER